jgi:hypothetical protein
MVKKDKGKKSKSKVKVDKLKVNRETIQDLTDADARKVRGGFGVLGGHNTETICSDACQRISYEPASPDCSTEQCKTVVPQQSDWCGSVKGCNK